MKHPRQRETLRTVVIATLYVELGQHFGVYMRQSLTLDIISEAAYGPPSVHAG